MGNVNRVLDKDFRASKNFYFSDRILKHYLENRFSPDAATYMLPKLEATGAKAALEMDSLSLVADKEEPRLVKRNFLGENLDEIRFHPAYNELLKIAVDSEMMRVKWEPHFREEFKGSFHAMGFGAGYLFAMSESGQYCPLCMTDGVALLVDRFCEPSDKDRLLPGIYTDRPDEFLTGAMFLTEKAGGSDVGANLVEAVNLSGSRYKLNGEKWFCSNANADIIFALARTNPEVKGTKGLSIFLVEPKLPNGNRNSIEFVRLKEKLGVRSMASAECIFHDTEATLVGDEFQGFPIMAEMINLSRLYNSVAALSASRRALIEAWQFLSFRRTFGKEVLDHALVRDKLLELGALNIGNFYLTWRAIEALDNVEVGNEEESQLLRLLTPMVKKWTAEKAVYLVRESMELMGGMGYIEDGVIPKLMRDVMVLPIWEGAGNIMVLDMLRAMMKSQGLEVISTEIRENLPLLDGDNPILHHALDEIVAGLQSLVSLQRDQMELEAKYHFEKLTELYQIALLNKERDDVSESWISPALDYWIAKYLGKRPGLKTRSEIEALIAWDF